MQQQQQLPQASLSLSHPHSHPPPAESTVVAPGVSEPGRQQTIYRDKQGREVDALAQYMKDEAMKAGTAARLQAATLEWGRARRQEELSRAQLEEEALVSAEGFARSAADPRIEAQRRAEIRDGDPLADYFLSKKEKKRQRQEEEAEADAGNEATSGKIYVGAGASRRVAPAKPKYSGPAPRRNRFGIPPGYRWDATDRGNGFEVKVIEMAVSKQASRSARDANREM
jgi:hypothetical protein